MHVRPSILIVEQNSGHRDLIEDKFRTAFPKARIENATSLADAHTRIRHNAWDVVIINSQLPDGRGIDFLGPLSIEQPLAAVVILTDDPAEMMKDDVSHHGVVEFLTKDRQTLDSFAARIKRLMATSDRISRMLKEGKATAARSAFRDPLTQVYSRNYFEESLSREVSRANRYRQDFCVLVADVDNMKALNRLKGHPAGDRCLKGLAQVILRSVRSGDIVARYGSDEFVVLLSQCCQADALRCAARIVNQLRRQARTSRFSASIGVVFYHGVEKVARPEKIMTAAMQAVAQARSEGGGRYLLAANSSAAFSKRILPLAR